MIPQIPQIPLYFSAEIQQARLEQRPIVALESTIISHGMPFPQNLETALEVEAVIRDQGATPATLAVLDGKIQIGLDADQLERFAQDKTALKLSRRDLGYALSRGKSGGTTVATTMILAGQVGIRFFATGGIGGVHRGGQNSLDISADLQELARTEVAVVCAGAKSILDLGRTLEYLETHGVPVIGYGTEDFPAFYTRSSGLKSDYRLDTPLEVAQLLQQHWALGLGSGVVIANPIPAKYALPESEINRAIEEALEELDAQNISGKAVTPFLLSKVLERSGGKSLVANIALVKNNAKVAAQIALEWGKMGF
jgi:pseudouridylate synthase